MAYVSVPKDLTKVKNKVAFNLTKRQLICIGIGAAMGIPSYVYFSFFQALNLNLFLSLFLNYTRDLKLFLLIYCSKISLKKIIKKIYKK